MTLVVEFSGQELTAKAGIRFLLKKKSMKNFFVLTFNDFHMHCQKGPKSDFLCQKSAESVSIFFINESNIRSTTFINDIC